jgi:uncharacterized protein (DUF697 family)
MGKVQGILRAARTGTFLVNLWRYYLLWSIPVNSAITAAIAAATTWSADEW